MTRLLLFCEANADSRTVSGLVDRVLRDQGPDWVGDLLDTYPESVRESVREWVKDEHARPFFDLHRLRDHARHFDLRVPHGHFEGRRGAPGAMMALTALLIARAIAKKGLPIDSVLIVWDMDDQGDVRRVGLGQARDDVSAWAPFRVVLGCPDREREAWVLAGFDAETDDERARLDAERAILGFSPTEEAHRLDAKDEQAKRSPKRVLRILTGGEAEREERCWTAAPLAKLRGRGAGSGLAAFLDEVAAIIVPQVTGPENKVALKG